MRTVETGSENYLSQLPELSSVGEIDRRSKVRAHGRSDFSAMSVAAQSVSRTYYKYQPLYNNKVTAGASLSKKFLSFSTLSPVKIALYKYIPESNP